MGSRVGESARGRSRHGHVVQIVSYGAESGSNTEFLASSKRRTVGGSVVVSCAWACIGTEPEFLTAGVPEFMHVGMHRHGAGIHLNLSVRSGSVAPPSHQPAGWRPPVGGELDKTVRRASEGRGGSNLRL